MRHSINLHLNIIQCPTYQITYYTRFDFKVIEGRFGIRCETKCFWSCWKYTQSTKKVFDLIHYYSDCGERSSSLSVPYIIGGSRSYLGQWPWVVGIKIGARFICGGSLISDQWVVTAAHCIERYVIIVSYKVEHFYSGQPMEHYGQVFTVWCYLLMYQMHVHVCHVYTESFHKILWM